MFIFVWAKNLIELCFSYFAANSWFDFREALFSRGSNMLIPDKAMPIGKAPPVVNKVIERLSVITTVTINSMPTAFFS